MSKQIGKIFLVVVALCCVVLPGFSQADQNPWSEKEVKSEAVSPLRETKPQSKPVDSRAKPLESKPKVEAKSPVTTKTQIVDTKVFVLENQVKAFANGKKVELPACEIKLRSNNSLIVTTRDYSEARYKLESARKLRGLVEHIIIPIYTKEVIVINASGGHTVTQTTFSYPQAIKTTEFQSSEISEEDVLFLKYSELVKKWLPENVKKHFSGKFGIK